MLDRLAGRQSLLDIISRVVLAEDLRQARLDGLLRGLLALGAQSDLELTTNRNE